MKVIIKKIICIICYLLIVICITSACSNGKHVNTASENSYLPSNSVYNTEISSSELPKSESFDDTPVLLSEKQYANFISKLNKVKIDYAYSYFYGIERAVSMEKKRPAQATAHTYEIEHGADNKIDCDTLVKIVKHNNDEYKNNTSSYKKLAYKDLTDEEISAYCKIITNVLNTEIAKNPAIDKDEVYCILGNLKMFSEPSTTSIAHVTDDNCMNINANMVKVLQNMNSGQDANVDTIIHETMHLLQKSCVDNEGEDDDFIGIAQKWDELEINPLFWRWFYEASAEKAMCHFTGDKPNTYANIINYLESFSMSTILNKNVSVNQTEYLCFQKNPELLYKQFGCDNNKEREELIKMMYTVDVLQFERDDFYDFYEKDFEKIDDDDEEALVKLQRELKVSICGTLSKKFYENLAALLIENELAIDDVFYIIRVFEEDLNNHLGCDDKDRTDANLKFLDIYLEIQDEFFEQLADSMNCSVDSIIRKFNAYKFAVNDMLLLNISSDKKEYIIERHQALINKGNKSMRQMNDELIKEK